MGFVVVAATEHEHVAVESTINSSVYYSGFLMNLTPEVWLNFGHGTVQ